MNSGTAAARTHLLSWGGPVQATNRIERGYRWWALGAVLLVMFTASISSTIVSTAVPTIVGDLHGFTLYAWVFFVTLPLVAVAGLIVGAILPRVRTPHERGQLDVSGSVLMTGGLVAVLLGFTGSRTCSRSGSASPPPHSCSRSSSRTSNSRPGRGNDENDRRRCRRLARVDRRAPFCDS
jgi:hypothetical protein